MDTFEQLLYTVRPPTSVKNYSIIGWLGRISCNDLASNVILSGIYCLLEILTFWTKIREGYVVAASVELEMWFWRKVLLSMYFWYFYNHFPSEEDVVLYLIKVNSFFTGFIVPALIKINSIVFETMCWDLLFSSPGSSELFWSQYIRSPVPSLSS